MDLFIWTDYATREMAVQNGYEAMVRQAGGHIVTSGCPLLFPKSCWEHVRGIAADGAKQAHYMRSEFDVPIYYGSMAACVDAAVDGCWTGER
jgi:predicted aconitase